MVSRRERLDIGVVGIGLGTAQRVGQELIVAPFGMGLVGTVAAGIVG
jgi:S1-C subfamily serine protease